MHVHYIPKSQVVKRQAVVDDFGDKLNLLLHGLLECHLFLTPMIDLSITHLAL